MKLIRVLSQQISNYFVLILVVCIIIGTGVKSYYAYAAGQDFAALAYKPVVLQKVTAEAEKVGMEPYDYYMKFIAPQKYPALKMNPLHAGFYTLYDSVVNKPYGVEYLALPISRRLMLFRTFALLFLSEVVIFIFGVPLARLSLKSVRVRSLIRFFSRVFAGLPVWAIGAVFALLVIETALPDYLVNGLASSTSVERTLTYMVFPLLSVVLVAVWEFSESLAILIRDEFQKEYVTAKRAMGLPESRVNRHVFRAVLPSFLGFLFQHVVEVATLVLVVDAFFGFFGLGKMIQTGFSANSGSFILYPRLFFYPITVFLILNFFLLVGFSTVSELLSPGGDMT